MTARAVRISNAAANCTEGHANSGISLRTQAVAEDQPRRRPTAAPVRAQHRRRHVAVDAGLALVPRPQKAAEPPPAVSAVNTKDELDMSSRCVIARSPRPDRTAPGPSRAIRCHDLRHTMASHAVMNGVPVPVVSRLLGHSNVQMTLRYAHLADRDIEAAAERVGAVMTRVMAGNSGDA